MSDLLERLLCIDGNCTGTINERRYCNVCGKSLDRKHDPLRVEQEVDARNRELGKKAGDLARAHERRKYYKVVNQELRRKAADLARAYYRGEFDYRTFWKQLPPEVSTEPKDEQIHELLDLIEHDPAVGGILGVSREEHETYVARIKLLIGELSLRILSELDLHEAAAFWQLELLPSEDLPEIAVSALENGCDSPSLRILAGETKRIASTVGPLFVKALHELGISLPEVASAQMTVARFYARKIIDGSMSPYQGARHIWWDVQLKAYSTQKENDVGKRLEIFAGLASEYEDTRRKKYEKKIIQEAKKLLSGSQTE